MSQPIGNAFKSRIPTFSDDASIQEAFSVYHYGKDNYTESEAVPSNSIEGHFVSANNRIGALESTVNNLGQVYVLKISPSLNPNVIQSEANNVSPLVLRGNSPSQNAPLQNWQNSSTTNVASVFNDGGAVFNNYVTVGNTTKSSSTALDVRIANAAHKGITVAGATLQTGNLQEWTFTDGSTTSIVARVNSAGKIFSNSGLTGTNTSEVVTETGTQTLTNKTLTSPVISGGSLSNATVNNVNISNFTSTVETNARSASYTLVLSDSSKVIEMSSTSANTLTIPTNASVPFPIGTQILIIQTNTGQTTVAGASGVIVNGTPGLKLRTQFALATLIKRGTNTWLLAGDVVA